jgi:hypothetical protein
MKKKKKSITFILIIVVLALLSGVGVASYIYNAILRTYNATAENGFYFTSDLLREVDVPVYDLYYDWHSTSDTIPISIVLKNSESPLNIATNNIDYLVTASSTSNSQTGTLVGGGQGDKKTVILNVPCTAVNAPFEVTVTATSTKPYKKTLTGKFIIHPLLTYSMDENAGKPVATLTITVAKYTALSKAVTIAWPAGAEPDMTNPIVKNATRNLSARTLTVNLDTASVYNLTFFKNKASTYPNYSGVTVVGS